MSASFPGLIGGVMEVRDGFMHITQEPGLGRSVDWEQIEARTVLAI